MRKATPPADPPKRGRGRPQADPAGKKAKGWTLLTPTQRAGLERDYGSVSGGLRALVEARYPPAAGG